MQCSYSLIAALLIGLVHPAKAVICECRMGFCDFGSFTCSGNHCVIEEHHFLPFSIQKCGNEVIQSEGCFEFPDDGFDFLKPKKVCLCKTDRCNTFNFLQSHFPPTKDYRSLSSDPLLGRPPKRNTVTTFEIFFIPDNNKKPLDRIGRENEKPENQWVDVPLLPRGIRNTEDDFNSDDSSTPSSSTDSLTVINIEVSSRKDMTWVIVLLACCLVVLLIIASCLGYGIYKFRTLFPLISGYLTRSKTRPASATMPSAPRMHPDPLFVRSSPPPYPH
ncbi:hypothetical protein QR680_006482 [Steinernema hermaphroditum]|uniref:Uncharacterized protein n=1 Tax=Steinernema hermaphroditum TaxID=289476 RepID=A0AA39HVR4_9BILA|nr:hypothetical protein QR680_006482 [Steinernema hermaphroditum]